MDRGFEKDIGESIAADLRRIQLEHLRIKEQLGFLQVELLDMQKMALQGVHHDSSFGIRGRNPHHAVFGWGNNLQSFGPSGLAEAWLDELGFYRVEVSSLCRQEKS
jgi:hypothetical protein